MSITEFSILPVGTRIRIRRGRFPMAPSLLGRTGTVVENSQYYAHKVEVTLDGESAIRTFAPLELEVLEEAAAALPPDQESARKRLARP